MVVSKAALRYSQALLVLASEKNIEDQLSKEISDLIGNLNRNNKIKLLLKSPLVHPSKKLDILKETFSDLSQYLSNLLSLLASKRRLPLLEEVLAGYQNLLSEKKGYTTAFLSSASELSKEEKEQIINKIKGVAGDKVQLIEKIDPDLIGGFSLKVNDLLLDNTVKKKLSKLRKQLSYN